MNQIQNKHILNNLTLRDSALDRDSVLDSYQETLKNDLRNEDAIDLISDLRANLSEVFQAQEYLEFMISELTSTLKKQL